MYCNSLPRCQLRTCRANSLAVTQQSNLGARCVITRPGCRFQQETRDVLTELGSSLLQGKAASWAGSPRGRPRRAQAPFAPHSDTEDDEAEQALAAAEAQQRHRQAELLVQPFQQLEHVIVAGESLCRQVCHIMSAAANVTSLPM